MQAFSTNLEFNLIQYTHIKLIPIISYDPLKACNVVCMCREPILSLCFVNSLVQYGTFLAANPLAMVWNSQPEIQ